ncbi:MAG: S9 family peptidase [Kangiellaceae bacterium]|nr:S9 family peptidase [Kangiellaceae bacterium]
MASKEPIQFKSRDGATIYGYLTKPNLGKEKYPLIVVVHGGPFGPRDSWFFDLDAQVFANAGYAVLQVNYRGSGGFGAKYKEVAYLKLHTMIMNDIKDGTRWAMSQKDIDNKACVYGWSFGGYAAARLSIFGDGLFKCAIAAAGVFDEEYQNTTADYSSSKRLQRSVAQQYGDDPKLWREQSPITYANQVNIPILIIHGGKDTRVPPKQAERFKDTLEKYGKTVEWLYKKEEPHGFLKHENLVEMYQKSIAFFDRYLKSS